MCSVSTRWSFALKLQITKSFEFLPQNLHKDSEMKAHIELDYNVSYILSFQLNTYHFPERATISTTPFQTLTLDRWPEAPPFQYQLLP